MPTFIGTYSEWLAYQASHPQAGLLKTEDIQMSPSSLYTFIDTGYPSGYSMRDSVNTEKIVNGPNSPAHIQNY